jgi:hypothetical protein
VEISIKRLLALTRDPQLIATSHPTQSFQRDRYQAREIASGTWGMFREKYGF